MARFVPLPPFKYPPPVGAAVAPPPAKSEWTERQKYVFKRKLEELAEYRGMGTTLVTLYVPPTRLLSDVAGMVRNEVGQASNIKSKGTQDAVVSALTSIAARLKNYKSTPPNGLAIFVGNVNIGGNKTDFVAEFIEPPIPIATYQYRCESTFNLEPLTSMGSAEDVYGLIILDRKECSMGFLRGKSIKAVYNRQSQVPSKHGRGGQSAQRFERLIEIAAHEWFTHCAERANEIFLHADLKALLLGGPGATKDFFAREGYLHHELQKKLYAQYFDTGYTDEDQGLKEMVENAATAIQGIAMVGDRKLMQQFLREVAKPDGGLGTYGEGEVRKALDAGAVAHLLISENVRKWRLSFTHRQTGEHVTKTVPAMQLEETVAAQAKLWGANNLTMEKRDLVEELSEIAETGGSEVHVVSSASEEGGMLMNAFGGVVALLRYKLTS